MVEWLGLGKTACRCRGWAAHWFWRAAAPAARPGERTGAESFLFFGPLLVGERWPQATGRPSWVGVDWAPIGVSGVGLKPLTTR